MVRLPPLSALTDSLFAPTLNMQALKAFDSPRRRIRGAVANLRYKLNQGWPKVDTALPPKRETILTPMNATYKVVQLGVVSEESAFLLSSSFAVNFRDATLNCPQPT